MRFFSFWSTGADMERFKDLTAGLYGMIENRRCCLHIPDMIDTLEYTKISSRSSIRKPLRQSVSLPPVSSSATVCGETRCRTSRYYIVSQTRVQMRRWVFVITARMLTTTYRRADSYSRSSNTLCLRYLVFVKNGTSAT